MKAHATKIGATGLVLWAFAAFFNSQLSAVPVFEILTIALGIGFLSGLARVVFFKILESIETTHLVISVRVYRCFWK